MQIYLPIADLPVNIFLILGMGLAVDAWTALEQPETATQAAAPAGGWDNFPGPPPANAKPRNPAPRPDRATPTAAR